MRRAEFNAHSLSLLLGTEAGQDQGGTDDAQATPFPGKHTQLHPPFAGPLYIYEIKCVPQNERNH